MFPAISKKQGFTMIEMLVVLGIIGIILSITFRINTNQITKLQLKNEVAKFEEEYNRHLSNALSTSIYQNTDYDYQLTEFSNENNTIIYNYVSISGTGVVEPLILDKAKIRETSPGETLSIKHKPYEIGCTINDDPSVQTGYVAFSNPQGNSNLCFTLSADTCKIKQIACQN